MAKGRRHTATAFPGTSCGDFCYHSLLQGGHRRPSMKEHAWGRTVELEGQKQLAALLPLYLWILSHSKSSRYELPIVLKGSSPLSRFGGWTDLHCFSPNRSGLPLRSLYIDRAIC